MRRRYAFTDAVVFIEKGFMKDPIQDLGHALISRVRDYLTDLPDSVPVAEFEMKRISDTLIKESVTINTGDNESLAITRYRREK